MLPEQLDMFLDAVRALIVNWKLSRLRGLPLHQALSARIRPIMEEFEIRGVRPVLSIKPNPDGLRIAVYFTEENRDPESDSEWIGICVRV